MIDECMLRDLGHTRQWYTWERGLTVEGRVRERLDRFIGSPEWWALYSNFMVEHLMRYKYDHTPILLSCQVDLQSRRKKKTGFKFETSWLLDNSCEEVVWGEWNYASRRGAMDKVKGVARGLVALDQLEPELDKLNENMKPIGILGDWQVDEEGIEKIIEEYYEDLFRLNSPTTEVVERWEIDLIEEAFNDRDRSCILQMELSMRHPRDEVSWAFSKDEGAYLLWAISMERNAKVFTKKETPHTVIVDRVYRWVKEYGSYTKRIYGSKVGNKKTSIPQHWQAPPMGIVKVNVDASLAEEGWIEEMALNFAIALSNRKRVSNAIFETDCEVVVNRLEQGAKHLTELDNLLNDALELSSTFSFAAWSHVRRDGNTVAHNL
ncbi:NADPH-dependent diflavin oxidoreductase 1, partial [Bienertia sinuspersici]